MDHQSTVPTLELTEPNKPNSRWIWTHAATAVVAGTVVAVYFTKYTTINAHCNITAEQVEFLKEHADGFVKFALKGRKNVVITMAPIPTA